MLAKVTPPRAPELSSFRTLIGYVLRVDKRGELPSVEEIAVPYWTNCLFVDTAHLEMRAAAAMNARVKDPVYHFILSWEKEDKPSDEEARGAGRAALEAVGLGEHQHVLAVHRDTDNVHLHVAVNRVHPETERAWDRYRDFYKLDRCCRELELEHGWKPTNGVFAVFERDGESVIDYASAKLETKGKAPSRVRDFERWTGQESLFSYARGEPRKAIVVALKQPDLTWSDLHLALGGFGLELREKGQGLGVYALGRGSEYPPVKASDVHEALSKKRLVDRLGPFVPRQGHVAPGHGFYMPEMPQAEPLMLGAGPAEASARQIALEKRATARRRLKDDYKAYKDAFRPAEASPSPADAKARYQAVTDQARVERARVTALDAPAAVKKAMYSQVAMEAALARQAVKEELASARRRVRSSALNKPGTYREWVADQAEAGTDAAIAQLRGWAHAEKRAAKRQGPDVVEENVIVRSGAYFPLNEPSVPPAIRRLDLRYRVDRSTGDVTYLFGNRAAFTDHGRQIRFSSAGAGDTASVDVALRLAREKFGRSLVINGSADFRQRAVEAVVRMRLDVTLTDPALEAFRRSLATPEPITLPSPPAPLRKSPAIAPVETPEVLSPDSRAQALEWIEARHQRGEIRDWRAANADAGRYAGEVVLVTPEHVVQDVGRGSVVVHQVADLDRPVAVGQRLSVIYREGHAVVEVRQAGRGDLRNI